MGVLKKRSAYSMARYVVLWGLVAFEVAWISFWGFLEYFGILRNLHATIE